MRLDKDHTGSGTYATDEFRTERGLAAANVLSVGHAARTVVGDHVGSETCAQVIARIGGSNPAKNAGSDASLFPTINGAVNNLRAGIGVHKASGDHGGGNTCAAVISAAV